MRAWFHARYCDPAEETPYNGREGGYQYIYGGPFDPADILPERFSHIVDEKVIKDVIDEMNQEVGDQWAPMQCGRDLDGDEQTEISESEDISEISAKKTYLLTYDPTRHPSENLIEQVVEIQEKGESIISWSVGFKGISKGDRVFFMRHDHDHPGIFGAGQMISDAMEGPHWDKTSPDEWTSMYADIRWDYLSERPIASLHVLMEQIGQTDLWTRTGSGHAIPANMAERLEQLWKRLPEIKALNNSSELGSTRTENTSVIDCLGRNAYTKALVQLLTVREDTKPYAIGLFGQWGSGKSSQIDQLKDLLQNTSEPSIRIVDFNAWAHERATNIAAALAQSVADVLVEKTSFLDQIMLAAKLSRQRRIKTIDAFERDRIRFRLLVFETWYIWSPATIAIIMFIFSVYSFIQSDIGRGVILLVIAIPTLLSTYFGSAHFIMKNLTGWFKKINFTKHIDKFRLPDYSTHLGLYHEIRKNLEHLCNLQICQDSDPKKGEYLLVIVDDLDRCDPEMVKQVFDAVRLVAQIPRVVTLVAIDERIAFSAVEQYYDKLGHAGRESALVARDYLAKVFQVVINLPQPNEIHVRNYIATKLFTDNTYNTSPEKTNIIFTNLSATNKSTKIGSIPSDSEVNDDIIDKISNQTPINMASNYTVNGEKELFTKLSIGFSFSNPRLLWRLMQSWKLLKCIVFSDTYHLSTAEPWLRLLFWREWMFQQSAEFSPYFHDWPFNSSKAIPAPILEMLPKHLDVNDYKQRCGSIDTVILPAATPIREAEGSGPDIAQPATKHSS